ncbi:MAG: DEAD/DEAH box helicase [Bacteroidota bacterium]
MSNSFKNRSQILDKLNIEALNEMQTQAQFAIHSSSEVILLSPTGTGKTLAFLLPLLAELKRDVGGVQLLILAPSRELAIQIEQVVRDMGTGFKTNVVYGGRPISRDKMELKNIPQVLIGTPGRIADHIRRSTFDAESITNLVLDEFDKSLEIGFEDEMEEIIGSLKNRDKIVLTSATENVEIPSFVGLENPLKLNFLDQRIDALKVEVVLSPEKDKLQTLVDTLLHIGNQPGIIFCNYKASIDRISTFLTKQGIDHGTFYGGMEQNDRERALIKFRNGTHQLLLATDLAARGIDVPEIQFIIHYHLPHRSQEFTHRNGRTARMQRDGKAIVIQWKEEELPDFIGDLPVLTIGKRQQIIRSPWCTLFISGGRKDKISKGDIAGLFLKQADVRAENLGKIELKNDCAFVAIKAKKIDKVILKVNNTKLKKKKVRIYQI